ncbi:MAG TPA: hypothetical protein VFO10_28695 [Oligoflexus sp.]|uniref:hypothetical protein n=1 Tax=Oligoflexus sp. TaxID=1971216 RepID=UPI002D801080|nr:hypothetical protein [Oligoflexus sp.]HET9241278.1 hypothetical protein [Oligoflexus sp.]
MKRSLTIALAAFLAACRSIPVSEPSHKVNDPTLGGKPYNWINITEEEYNSILMYGHEQEFNLRASGLAAVDHPARKRLQALMDAFDAKLRSTYPEQLRDVPAPVAHLVLTGVSNAVVYNISVCLSRAGYLPALKSGQTRYWQYEPTTEDFTYDTAPEKPVLCVKRKFSDQETVELFKNITGASGVVSEKGALQLPDSLSARFSAGAPSRAADIALLQVPNAITFYAGLLIENTEEDIVFWLAHELGHYYRAHGMTAKNQFAVYYDLTKKNPGTRPRQTKALAEFGARMEALRRLMTDGTTRNLNAAQKKEWKELNREAFEKKIGQYTAEQEADELALEWILKAGFDRDLPIRALLAALKSTDPLTSRRPQPEQEWSYDRCTQAFETGWKDLDDLPVFVPVGDYHDEHHSSCYRAFNLFRETQTHKYPIQASADKLPLLSPDAWIAIQKRLLADVKALEL